MRYGIRMELWEVWESCDKAFTCVGTRGNSCEGFVECGEGMEGVGGVLCFKILLHIIVSYIINRISGLLHSEFHGADYFNFFLTSCLNLKILNYYRNTSSVSRTCDQ